MSVTVATATGGLTASTSAVYPQNGLVFYGLSVVVTGGSSTVNTITVTSSSGVALTSIFGTVALYHSNSSSYDGTATQITGAALALSSSGITFTSVGETLTNQTKYYYLVYNDVYTGTSATYYQPTGLSVTCSTGTYSPSGYENYYNLNPTSVNVASATGGLTSSSASLVPAQTGIALFGFSVTVQGISTISAFNINSTTNQSTPGKYLANGKLYRSTSSTYSSGTAMLIAGSTVTGTAVTFNGAYVNITGLNEAYSSQAGQTYYYYLVADYIVYTGITPGTAQFNFTSGQSSSALVQSSPVAANLNTYGFSESTYTFTNAITLTSYNTAANGITQGGINYGDKAEVFAFSISVIGTLTVNQISIATVGPSAAGNYFSSTGTIYHTTDQYGSNPVAISGATINTYAFNTGVSITGLSDVMASGTTNYYYLVLNYDNINVTADATIQFEFTTSQNFAPITQTTPSASYFPNAATGPVMNIGVNYDWVGLTDMSFTNVNNYRNLNNGNLSISPTQYDQVRIGVVSYLSYGALTQPTISASTSIAKMIFGSNNTPQVTVNSGQTFTVSKGITVNTSGYGSIIGPGIFNIGATSTVNSSAVFTLQPSAIMSLNDGSSSLANNGTFTLASSSAGSATIAAIPTGGTFTGNYNVQRYATGGTGRRSYRLLSSPVYTSTYLGYPAYGFKALQATTIVTGGALKGTYSATQPTDAFDPSPTGNPSVFFYYEPNKDPINKVIANSDYKGISSIDALFPIGNGFLFFFRGNRNATDGTGISKLTTSAVAESTALNFYGTLNQGSINVAIPTGAIAAISGTYPSPAATISTTFSYTNSTATSDGLHLVGNPYPATIDLESVTLNNPYSPYSVSNGTHNYIYMLNATGTFGTYDKGSSSTTLNNGVGRYVLSGQGFMVRGNSSGATVTFSESNKVNITPTATTPTSFAVEKLPNALAMNRNLNAADLQESRAFVDNQLQVMHILLSLDSVNANETVIQFGKGQNKFSGQEDAYYMSGLSQTTFMASYTTDAQPCLVNQMGSLDSITSIPLYAQGLTSGLYKMQFSGASSIDPKFKIYLKDNLLKDSLDLSANTLYNFNIDITNAATYGATRFVLVVYPTNIASYYHLLNFKGAKLSNGVQLTWNTQFEGDYTGFTLQRSVDGWKTSIVLDTLQSNGSGSYNFMDRNPIDGQNQYRLVQNNINNQNILSNIVTIGYQPVTSVNDKIQLYPNPAVSVINVNVKTENNPSYLTLKIFNTNGVLLVNTKTTSVNSFSQDVSKLTTGNYIIDITDNNTKHYGTVLFTKL